MLSGIGTSCLTLKGASSFVLGGKVVQCVEDKVRLASGTVALKNNSGIDCKGA